ncbi:MAG TPA: metallophosphoesterase [Noviherbaspirillum sp.]|jgi:hypothetical protein|uniref:metallophosphoesterase family protein n=1 Tax=Noviherbaspirillum sp. TaxID=1926288 RepID=UPI002F9251B5
MAKLRSLLSPPRALLVLPLACALSACVSESVQQEEVKRTALLKGKGVTLFAAGDIADCRRVPAAESGAAKTAALVEARLAADPAAFVLTLGDHTYPVGLLQEFIDCYEPTWGRFKSRTYPVPGNHEYYTPHAVGYYTYFGARAGEARRGYYSFRAGSWHLIALNSYLKPDDHAQQLAWLKAELKTSGARCTLAFWHHPVFSSGGHGNNSRMRDAWDILHAAGADVILASHDHDYERFAPQDGSGQRDDARGIRQFVVGTGGAKLTPFRFRNWNTERSDNLSHGVLKLALKDAGYEWEFLPVDKDGFTDAGSTLCH